MQLIASSFFSIQKTNLVLVQIERARILKNRVERTVYYTIYIDNRERERVLKYWNYISESASIKNKKQKIEAKSTQCQLSY